MSKIINCKELQKELHSKLNKHINSLKIIEEELSFLKSEGIDLVLIKHT